MTFRTWSLQICAIRKVRREADQSLKLAFAETRSQFASGLEETFNHSLLLAAELAQTQFGESVSRFRELHPDFPLTAGLAELWALGDSGECH